MHFSYLIKTQSLLSEISNYIESLETCIFSIDHSKYLIIVTDSTLFGLDEKLATSDRKF